MPSAEVWTWGESGLSELVDAAVIGMVEVSAALAVVLVGLSLVSRIAR